ncbi:MAG: hypothetical protein K2X48_13325 [Chitinophagaceae bacterium]|nr:hypothetical protein [Chitinophagaceae bacterium]
MNNTFIVRVKKKNKVSFTETLLKSFDFLEVEKGKPKTAKGKTISEKKEAELVNAFKEVKLHMEGKKKLKTASEFLKEL